MILKAIKTILCFLLSKRKYIYLAVLILAGIPLASIAIGLIYERIDNDPDRGAIAVQDGMFGESYSVPIYLDQGWSESDSLWFYNTTQGSALLPYDFYLSLELPDSKDLLRSNKVLDQYRYLPQKDTFLNPDGLALGFVKDSYRGKDYMGYTCAACHTSQVNYQGKAIRIDGGPAMADMVGYLTLMEKGLKQSINDSEKNKRFVTAVVELDNDYDSASQVNEDLRKWADTIELYNTVNHSNVEYGYARLDAFGRIYNRVLQYVPNKIQVYDLLTQVTGDDNQYIITRKEASNVLDGINETIIGDEQFTLILKRLMSKESGFPGLSHSELLKVRNALFNEPDAPVSYPFLWDIAHSDYVQWNGIANNSGIGPLGRNTGEVIGVFGILDWTASDPGFSLSSMITGQDGKKKVVDFQSSIDLFNLHRLESRLGSLQSPVWPEGILGEIDTTKAARGRKIYGQYCQSCHEFVDRSNPDRIIIGKFSNIEKVGTDPAMAENSVKHVGKSGNFKHTRQNAGVGDVIIEETAPVAQILTSVTKGVVTSPDADKWFFRRWVDWLYLVLASLFDNPIKGSIKAGDYIPDTTANPYNSLLSYKGRSLNGIWATAPYLHNGSVPTLYDLLLPSKKPGVVGSGPYRPESFVVGSREFDPVKVGFRSGGYDGHEFVTSKRGDQNDGHEYAAGITAQMDGSVLPPLNEVQRWELVEFLKSL